MQKFLTLFLDFLFPVSPESLRLRQFSPEKVAEILPKATETPYPFINPLFSYKDPLVKELIKNIKNKKDGHSISCAAHAVLKNLSSDKLLVPIPISSKRRRERGYNQCELIIDEMLNIKPNLKKEFRLLERAKDRGEQKLKDRAERLSDSSGIFKVNPIVPMSAPIVLLDDVVTTGSTLKEARNALLSKGFSNVTAIAIAH
jgi:ComF family protein